MAYKRILTIQDISCIGQCSMTVALPILSACGLECCILPTAVLSTHTGGFGKPALQHLADGMDGIIHHWRSLGITFDAVLVGYLGSVKAAEMAGEILDTMLSPGGIGIVDPAMADHGKLYAGFDEAYVQAMKGLCAKADVLLPNITEAAMLAGLPYRENGEEAWICQCLAALGPPAVVLTGAGLQPGMTGVAVKEKNQTSFYQHEKIGKNYHGTGDIYAACLTGGLMQGMPLRDAAALAADFTCKCIAQTEAAPAHWYGVKFEQVLPWLISRFQERL